MNRWPIPAISVTGLSPADTAAARAALREIRRRAQEHPDALAEAANLRALDVLGYDVVGTANPAQRSSRVTRAVESQRVPGG